MRCLHEEVLVGVVAAVALASVVGTFIVIDELHRPSPLLAYALAGLVLGPILITLVRVHRAALFGTAPASGRRLLSRSSHE